MLITYDEAVLGEKPICFTLVNLIMLHVSKSYF